MDHALDALRYIMYTIYYTGSMPKFIAPG